MNTTTIEAARRSELLKALLEAQQKLAVANQEHVFLLKRVATLENALRTSPTSSANVIFTSRNTRFTRS
jgi:hypothetical protein